MVSQNPILSSTFWRRLGAASDSQARDEVFCLDVQPLIAAFPGPAILFGAGGNILAANRDAERLVSALSEGGAKDVRGLHAGVAATGRPAIGQILLPSNCETGAPQSLLYLSAIPLATVTDRDIPLKDRRVLIVARDGSAEYAMRSALIESRDLYRDLSRCSSDFAWQTDENGAFTFVSAKGALGYSAQALNGRRSLELIDRSTLLPDANPFAAREAIENIEIALHDANGDLRYCKIHAVPVYDRQNHWRGARGVSTDVTEARLHAHALEAMRQRENHIRAIVDATHRSLDPQKAFSEAAAIIAKATGAAQCTILTLDPDQQLREIGVYSAQSGKQILPEALRERLFSEAIVAINGQIPLSFIQDSTQHQLVVTTHGGRPNGAIWLQFSFPAPVAVTMNNSQPEEHSCSLAETVASHIGIAIAHDRQMRKLATLSRTDELTGLMNRRAFMEDLSQRHAHLYRTGRKCALLYIDLDNFKCINDRQGHAAGDKVLQEFANLLRNHSRAGDISARLGGDEFALWLEDTDESGAAAKGRLMIEDMKSLHKLTGLVVDETAPKLGLSIGIGIADPAEQEGLAQLIKRSDEIMYQVKRRGKGSMLVAPAAAP